MFRFYRVLCVPASSTPVERAFSQSGLIMRLNRGKMSDKVLDELIISVTNDI